MFSPYPGFLLPGCYPESNNVTTSAPPTYSDVQYLLFVPSLLVLCPPLPVLRALAFPACPRLRAPPPWRPQLGITISSEGLSAALALPSCPHSLYPFLMSLRQNYRQPICSPTPPGLFISPVSILSSARASLKLTALGYSVCTAPTRPPSHRAALSTFLSPAQRGPPPPHPRSRIWGGRKGRVKAWGGRGASERLVLSRGGGKARGGRDCAWHRPLRVVQGRGGQQKSVLLVSSPHGTT